MNWTDLGDLEWQAHETFGVRFQPVYAIYSVISEKTIKFIIVGVNKEILNYLIL